MIKITGQEFNRLTKAAASCVAAFGIHATAAAQAQGQAVDTQVLAEESTEAGGEIIVTAQRRQQSLEKVPIAMTVLTSDTIKAANITDTLSFSKLAPNTSVRYWGAAPNIFIRGIGVNDFNASTVAPVSMYRDEVVLVSVATQVYPLFDLERVEVLKGPQGTLFGRNTTGGAVMLVSRRPGQEFEGTAVVTIGSYGEHALEGAVTLPVSADWQLRVAGIMRQSDGERINMATGRRADGIDVLAGRLVSVLKPTGDLTITTIFYGGKNQSDSRPPKPLGVLAGQKNALGYTDPYAASPELLNFNGSVASEHWDVGVTNIAELQLGAATIKAITAYDKSSSNLRNDVDGSTGKLNHTHYLARNETFSQELNVSGDTGPLKWVAGLFYLTDDLKYQPEVWLLGDLAGIGRDLPIVIKSGRKTHTYAAYAQATYALADRFRVTGGLRYTQDELRSNVGTQLIYGYFDPAVPDSAPINLITQRAIPQSFGRWSYRAAAEYDLAERTMLYASINHSFKQGGVYLAPTSSPAEAEPFKPESTTSYEAGIKSVLAGGAIRFNLAGFYNDYKDLQVVALIPDRIPPALKIQNAASASMYGIEADFSLQPIEGLRIDGGLGWLHARFRSYPKAAPNPAGGFFDYSGNPLPMAPNWTGNFAITYEVPVKDGWSLALRTDYNFVSRRYFNAAKDPIVNDGGYGLLGARVSLRSPDEKFELALWGRNLADTTYLENASDLRVIGFIPQYYGARRSIGATATIKF